MKSIRKQIPLFSLIPSKKRHIQQENRPVPEGRGGLKSKFAKRLSASAVTGFHPATCSRKGGGHAVSCTQTSLPTVGTLYRAIDSPHGTTLTVLYTHLHTLVNLSIQGTDPGVGVGLPRRGRARCPCRRTRGRYAAGTA